MRDWSLLGGVNHCGWGRVASRLDPTSLVSISGSPSLLLGHHRGADLFHSVFKQWCSASSISRNNGASQPWIRIYETFVES